MKIAGFPADLSKILDSEYKVFKENFPKLLPALKQYDCKEKSIEDHGLFEKFLEQVKTGFYDEEDFQFPLEILNNISGLIDPDKDFLRLIEVNLWRLKASIPAKGSYKIPIELLLKSIENCFQRFPGQEYVQIIYKNLSLLSQSFNRIKLNSNRNRLNTFFITVANMTGTVSPYLKLVMQILILESQNKLFNNRKEIYEEYLQSVCQQINSIELLDNKLMNEIISSMDNLNALPSTLYLISMNVLNSIKKSSVTDLNLPYYLMTWNILLMHSILKMPPSETNQIVDLKQISAEIIRNGKLMHEENHPRKSSKNLIDKLGNCLYQLQKFPQNYIIISELATIYILLAPKMDSYSLVENSILCHQFDALKYIFNQLAYLKNFWEIVKLLPEKLWRKLTYAENPFQEFFFKFLILRLQDSSMLNKVFVNGSPSWLPLKHFSLMQNVNNNNSLKSKYLYDFNNYQFLLGIHPLLNNESKFNRLALNMPLREKIMLFCAHTFYQNIPSHIVLSIMQSQMKPRAFSAGLKMVAACAAHKFVINWPDKINSNAFDRLIYVLSGHLAKAVGREALIIPRSLRELIYQKVIKLADEKVYLTDKVIQKLIEEAKKEDDAIHLAMNHIGLAVRDILFRYTGLLPLDLSIFQLVTALRIQWVTQSEKLSLKSLEDNWSFMAFHIGAWLIKVSSEKYEQTVEADQKLVIALSQLDQQRHRTPQYYFFLPQKNNLSAESIEIREINWTPQQLGTIFSENFQQFTQHNKRKRKEPCPAVKRY